MVMVIESDKVGEAAMVQLARALARAGRAWYAGPEGAARRRDAQLVPEGLVFVADLVDGQGRSRFDPDGVGRLLRVEDSGRVVIEPLHRRGVQGWVGAVVLPLPEDAGAWLERRSVELVEQKRAEMAACR